MNDADVNGPSDNTKKKCQQDPQTDVGLIVVDIYTDTGEKPLDSDPNWPSPSYDPQDDGQLQVIDEYNVDNENDDHLTVIHSYNDDGQSDDNLSIADRYDDKYEIRIKNDYKKKYLGCLKAHKIQRTKFLRQIAKIESHHKSNLDQVKKPIHNKFQEEIDKLKSYHQRRMSDLEDLMLGKWDDEIQNLNRKHERWLNAIKISQKKNLMIMKKSGRIDCQNLVSLHSHSVPLGGSYNSTSGIATE